MRLYLVVPADGPVLAVEASSPHTALRKAERGKAEPVDVRDGLAVAASRTTSARGHTGPIPGQLALEEAA